MSNLQLKEKIQNDVQNTEKRYFQENSISYTLITKILLGTIGCIPAYDRFFIDGLGSNKYVKKRFNSTRSFKELIEFYEINKKEIDEITKKCKGYVPMKIIDMYFWEIGIELDRLPPSYTQQDYDLKCQTAFQHVFDNYFGEGLSVYAGNY